MITQEGESNLYRFLSGNGRGVSRKLSGNQEGADDEVATIMAAVSNKTGWIGHDIDDPDNDEETNDKIKAEHDAWWELEKELYAEIIRRLEEENRTKGTAYVTGGIGLYYIIKPFMERNGYRDGVGWWIKEDK